jgi:hypothetical protein
MKPMSSESHITQLKGCVGLRIFHRGMITEALRKSPESMHPVSKRQFCFPKGAHSRAPVPKVWIFRDPHSQGDFWKRIFDSAQLSKLKG